MRQYTTPTLSITVKGVDLTSADSVWVTISNSARDIVITKESPTMTLDGTNTLVSVTLSQAETGQLLPNSRLDVEVNWMTGTTRCATEIASLVALENLLKEVKP